MSRGCDLPNVVKGRHCVMYWLDSDIHCLMARIQLAPDDSSTATFPTMVYGTEISCVKEALIWAEAACCETFEILTRRHKS